MSTICSDNPSIPGRSFVAFSFHTFTVFASQEFYPCLFQLIYEENKPSIFLCYALRLYADVYFCLKSLKILGQSNKILSKNCRELQRFHSNKL